MPHPGPARAIMWLGAVVTVFLVAVFGFIPPIPQDLAYHCFADTRTLLGIPNFWNVIGNLSFLLVGGYGLVRLRRIAPDSLPNGYRMVLLVFCTGFVLTGIGSGYYHLTPNNNTLVWDRLPMTVSFMAFFTLILVLHVGERFGFQLLWPLLGLGALSVFYWDYTESLGRGDLRLYGLVQFLPAVLIPIILLALRRTDYKHRYIWWVIGMYALAKLAEVIDRPLYELISLSGHSIKHVIASFAGVAVYRAIGSINYSDRRQAYRRASDNPGQ